MAPKINHYRIQHNWCGVTMHDDVPAATREQAEKVVRANYQGTKIKHKYDSRKARAAKNAAAAQKVSDCRNLQHKIDEADERIGNESFVSELSRTYFPSIGQIKSEMERIRVDHLEWMKSRPTTETYREHDDEQY